MDHKPPTPTIEAAHSQQLEALPFTNTSDYDDADRGFIGATRALCRQGRRRPRGVGQRCLRIPERRRAGHGASRACGGSRTWPPSRGCTRWSRASTRSAASTCPTSASSRATPGSSSSTRWSPPETAAAALALYRATPRRTAGGRGDLHAQPRRPFRWGARCDQPGRRRRRQGRGARARGLHRARGAGERLCRARRWRAAPATCTARPWRAVRQGQVGCGLGQTPSTGEVGDDRADPRHHARPARPTPSTVSRSSSRWRRAPRRPPKCTSTSRGSARCAWPRTPPTTCTTC